MPPVCAHRRIRAGHSVEVLLTIYAKCIEGHDRVWFERVDEALGDDPA